MKKSLKCVVLLISIISSLMLTSCGDPDMKQLRKAQDKIVSIGKQFLNYDLTADEARTQLEGIIIPDIGLNSLSLETDKNALSYEILIAKNNSSSLKNVKDIINDIKTNRYEKIGE